MRHEDLPAARTGAAVLDPAPSQIAPLKDLRDYKVAKEDPDVRGWKVIGRDGRTIGKVNDLLVDTGALRVRYLDVELDQDLVASTPPLPGASGAVAERVGGHHVLLPIGFARLDEEHDRVYLDGMDAQDVAILPTYDHRATFNRDSETDLRRRYQPGWNPMPGRDYYADELYDEERFYGPRRRRRPGR